MSEETITYWAWMVSNGDGAVYAGISEFRIARALLPGAALPVVPEDLGRHHPRLRRREHEQWSASELGREQFRKRQAEILREMVDVLPPGPVVPRAAAVGLLLGSCLLVLADGGRREGAGLCGRWPSVPTGGRRWSSRRPGRSSCGAASPDVLR
ncbi:hypothetical protein ACVW0K_000024 [Streptomyces filamentosus]